MPRSPRLALILLAALAAVSPARRRDSHRTFHLALIRGEFRWILRARSLRRWFIIRHQFRPWPSGQQRFHSHGRPDRPASASLDSRRVSTPRESPSKAPASMPRVWRSAPMADSSSPSRGAIESGATVHPAAAHWHCHATLISGISSPSLAWRPWPSTLQAGFTPCPSAPARPIPLATPGKSRVDLTTRLSTFDNLEGLSV